MTNHLIDDEVDIYSKPEIDLEHPANDGAQITIGDLHGNCMKLIFMLCRHGIIRDISDTDYLDLVTIYKKDFALVTADDLLRFNSIIQSLSLNRHALIRLLGDEFCDRGANDYFTLLVLNKMQQENVAFEIILSNHSAEFIEAYETKLKFYPSMLENHFSNSMIGMQYLILKKLITREEVLSIIKNSYKPNLKAISYSLNEDNNAITIFSHAAIDIHAIRSLALKLSVEFADHSAIALAQTIDAINAEYQNYVQKNAVHSLFDRKAMSDGYELKPMDSLYTPFEFITWNRDLAQLENAATHKGYFVFYMHGHDSEISEKSNVITLDNSLGKSSNRHFGHYIVNYSHEKQLSLQNKLPHHLSANLNKSAAGIARRERWSNRGIKI